MPHHAGRARPLLGIPQIPQIPQGIRACSPPVCPPPLQICVSKCPDRYLTYLTAQANPTSLEYYRNFCTPEFKGSKKVGYGVGVPVLWGHSCPER